MSAHEELHEREGARYTVQVSLHLRLISASHVFSICLEAENKIFLCCKSSWYYCVDTDLIGRLFSSQKRLTDNEFGVWYYLQRNRTHLYDLSLKEN